MGFRVEGQCNSALAVAFLLSSTRMESGLLDSTVI